MFALLFAMMFSSCNNGTINDYDLMTDPLFENTSTHNPPSIINNDTTLLNNEQQRTLLEKEIKMSYAMKSKTQNIVIISTSIVIILLIIIFLIQIRTLRLKREKEMAIINSALLKTTLYNQITDEIKSPITIIKGMTDKIKQNIDDGSTTKVLIDLDIIKRQTENILFLINDTLIHSQFQDTNKTEWVVGNIIPYLQILSDNLKSKAEMRGVTLLFLSSHSVINMNFCKNKLKVVINNIIMMFIKDSIDNEKILFNVRHVKNEKLCVINISHKKNEKINDNIPNIFKELELEYGNEHSLSNFDNVIAINNQLVEGMDGKFSYQRDLKDNLTFTIELPVISNNRYTKFIHSDDKESTNNIIDIEKKGVFEPTNNIQNKNSKKDQILLVEDNQFMSYYISSLLSDKYSVVVAKNGIEALNEIEKNMPDLVITDLIMPQMDGNQLTEIIKKTPSTSLIPVIMITIKDSDKYRIQSIRVGVDAFLVKPFIEEELQALVEQQLESRKEILKMLDHLAVERPSKPSVQIDEEDTTFIQKVRDIVQQEIANGDLSTQIIADRMFISPSHLNRRIKSITDLSTTGFIFNIRLNRAKRLLITTQKQIGEIASECGFNDFAYFSRSFKKEFGLTPSQYQRMRVE